MGGIQKGVRNMLNIAVCEDDVSMGSYIERCLYQQAFKEGLDINIEVMDSFEGCLKYIRETNEVDLLFLDIELGNKNGIQLADFIRNDLCNDYLQIVYVSAKQSYAMELFETHPLNFLVKPIDEKKLADVFRKAARIIGRSEETFCYKIGHAYKKEFLSNILYFEANNREVVMYTNEGRDVFYGTLKKIGGELTKRGFFFCHKSFLVHYKKVKIFEPNQLVMENGSVIPISQARRKEVKEMQLDMELRNL